MSRLPAPPGWLDPVIAFAERVDRRRLGIRPIRRGGVLALHVGRHHGAPVVLRDGTVVAPGAPLGLIHFDNAAVRDLASPTWETEAFRVARLDLAALARWARAQPPGRRPVAYFGATIMWPFARRAGMEARDRRPTFRARLEDWYLRGVLAHWSRLGRERLARGRGTLRTREVWLSDAALQRRYGSEAEAEEAHP